MQYNSDSKILPFNITRKMVEDESMDEFLKKSIIEAGDKYEEALENDPLLKDIETPPEMLANIKKNLRAAGYAVTGEDADEEDGLLMEDLADVDFLKNSVVGEKTFNVVIARETPVEDIGLGDDAANKVVKEELVSTDEVLKSGAVNNVPDMEKEQIGNKDVHDEFTAKEIEILLLSRKFIANGGDITSVERMLSSGETINTHNITGPTKTRRGKRKLRLGYIGAAALVLIGVFGGTMTSSANRRYILETFGIKTESGYELRTIITDPEQSTPELDAFVDIQEKTGLIAPMINSISSSLIFDSYTLDEKVPSANLEYYYEKSQTFLHIAIYSSEGASVSSFVTNSQSAETITMDKYYVELMEEINSQTGDKSYHAQFEYLNCIYRISAVMDRELFLDMIEKLNFKIK